MLREIVEAKVKWYIDGYKDEWELTKTGAGMSAINIYWDKKDGYSSLNINKQGDVGAKGTGPTKDQRRAANEIIKEHRLSSFSIPMMMYMLEQLKLTYETNKIHEIEQAGIDQAAGG